jgi:hypothetical protein
VWAFQEPFLGPRWAGNKNSEIFTYFFPLECTNERTNALAYETGQTAAYNPETGKTCATFVPSENVLPPKGISLARKPDRSGPSRKQPIFRGATEGFSILFEAISEEMALIPLGHRNLFKPANL